MPQCKGCGREIWFIRMTHGGCMPVNEQPVAYIPGEGDNKYVTEDGNVVQGRDWQRGDGLPREYGYISHFATCPAADKFRRRSMAKMIPDKTEAKVWELGDTRIKMDIGAYLAATGKELTDLALMVGLSRSTMYSRWKHPGDLSLDEARRLYRVIGKVIGMAAA